MNAFILDRLVRTLERDYHMNPVVVANTLCFNLRSKELKLHMMKSCTVRKFVRKERRVGEDTGGKMVTVDVYETVPFIKSISDSNKVFVDFTDDSNLDSQMVNAIDYQLREWFKTHSAFDLI